MALTENFKRRLLQLALAMTVAGFVVLLSSIWMAIPLLGFGIWYQSEGVLAVTWIASGVLGIGLALAAAVHVKMRDALTSPWVLVPAALAVWSLIVLPWHALPYGSILGSEEIGEGVLWYASFALMIAAGLILRHVTWARRLLLAAAVANTGVAVAASVAYFEGYIHDFIPYYFRDHFAFSGIGLGVLVATLSKGPKWLRLGLGAGVGAAVILASTNNAAIGATILLVPVSAAAWQWLPFSEPARRRTAFALVFAAPVLLTGFIVRYDLAEYTRGVDWRLTMLANSITSRHHLTEIVGETLSAEPFILAVGSGWGRYGEYFATHLPVEWAVLVDDPLSKASVDMTQWWDAVHRVDFHSHNFILEALLGAGLPAMVLTIAIYAILPLWTRRRYAVLGIAAAGSLSVTAAMWFMFAPSLPILALAFSGLAGPVRRRSRPIGIAATATAAAFGIGLLISGVESASFANYAHKVHFPMETPLIVDGHRSECPEEFRDRGRGGHHLAQRLRAHLNDFLSALQEGQDISAADLKYVRGAICVAEHYMDSHAVDVRMRITELLGRGDFAFVPSPSPAAARLIAAYASNWERRLSDVMAIAPDRTDLALTFLLDAFARNDEVRLRKVADRIYTRNPLDPVGLWFTGLALTGSPEAGDVGVQRMRQALTLGIERLLPVDPQIKAQLLGSETETPAFRLPVVPIVIETATGTVRLTAEVADTPETRKIGFYWRTSLVERQALLSTFEDQTDPIAYHANIFVPLDDIFLSEDLRIVHIEPGITPQNPKPVVSPVPAHAVLQVKAGFVGRYGISLGQQIRILDGTAQAPPIPR